jgi:thioester reductase-like protein
MTTEEFCSEYALITGFPAFKVQRLAQKLLHRHPETRIAFLFQKKDLAARNFFLEGLDPQEQDRIEWYEGNLLHMDLGLSGEECQRLFEQISRIYHLENIYHRDPGRKEMFRANVDATTNLLDFAREVGSLERFIHWSSALVASQETGVIMEDELPSERPSANFDLSKWKAEKVVGQAMADLPLSIVRPSVIVGDSRTGEVEQFEGPYQLLLFFLALPFSLPLRRLGNAPLHLVPIDYVIDALVEVSHRGESGKTYHLTDPNPLSIRRVYELMARLGRENPLARNLATQELSDSVKRKFPRLARALLNPRTALDLLGTYNRMLFYNCRNTVDLLDPTKVRCPSFDSYAERLIGFLTETLMAREQATQTDADIEDALDA